MLRHEMRIGEVSQRTDTPASTIRYYEEIGLLEEPPRASGRRVYGSGVLEQLQAIKAAKELGFTLDEIKTLMRLFEAGGASDRSGQALVQQKIEEMDALIAQATQMRKGLQAALECRCTGIGDCVILENVPSKGDFDR